MKFNKTLFLKIFFLLFAVPSIVFCGCISVWCASSASFSLGSAECRVGRSFSVKMTVSADFPVTAAVIVFHFDSAALEFSDLTKNNHSVYYSESFDGLRVVFADSSGIASTDDALFTLKFKSKTACSTEITYTVEECVDGNACFAEVGRCVPSSVLITEGSSGGNSSSRATRVTSPKATKAPKITEPRPPKPAGITAPPPSEPEYRSVKPLRDRADNLPVIAVIVVAVCFACVAVFTFLIGRGTAKNKTQNNNTDDEGF